MSAGALLVGLLFIWLACGIRTHDSNTVAAVWLGILLAAVGLAGIIFAEDVVTTVYPAHRCLRIDCRRRWGKLMTIIPFEDVESINIVRIGSRSDGLPSFWLQIQRKSGKIHPTGRWSTDEIEMRQLAKRLSEEIGCGCRGGRPMDPASVGSVAIALIGAMAVYAGWFYFSVGPWCRAMWFGTLPPVFILTAFGVFLGIIRRFRI